MIIIIIIVINNKLTFAIYPVVDHSPPGPCTVMVDPVIFLRRNLKIPETG